MFGYILLKNQEIILALAHLRARQEQTTPTIAEMDSEFKLAAVYNKPFGSSKKECDKIQRTFSQTMSASAGQLSKRSSSNSL